jgi:hypothetical protein
MKRHFFCLERIRDKEWWVQVGPTPRGTLVVYSKADVDALAKGMNDFTQVFSFLLRMFEAGARTVKVVY